MVPLKLGLGYMVWWSLPDTIHEKRSDWETRFSKEFALPTEPLGDALRRALFAVKAPKGTKRLVRPLQGHDEWALVLEVPHQGKDPLVYSVEMAVRLSTTELEIIRGLNTLQGWHRKVGGFAKEVRDNYAVELERVTPGCVADLILAQIRGNCLAVQARKTGGVYFVTQDYQDNIERVANFVREVGGTMYWFPLNETSETKQDLLKLVVEDLKNSIELARANIEARHKSDAVVESNQALERVRYYREALGLAAEKAQEIEKELNDLLVEALTKKERKGKETS